MSKYIEEDIEMNKIHLISKLRLPVPVTKQEWIEVSITQRNIKRSNV